jgi:hypothetical protein
MKNISIHVFALLLCHLFFVQNIFASDFKVVKKQGDIVLYERWITGDKGESVRELKAEFFVKSNTENVIALLKNQPEGTKCNRNASAYKIANTFNDAQWINYIKYDMPAIMDDQECCLLYQLPSSFSQQQNVHIISFESTLSPLFPVSSDVTRITGVRGQWILEQLSNENMKVTYIISSDKSSNIPRFISDPIIHNNLFKTMTNFKTLLEK